MNPTETIQLILGLVAVGGIGGVWFRLGSLTAKHDGHQRHLEGHERRLDGHERRLLTLESKL